MTTKHATSGDPYFQPKTTQQCQEEQSKVDELAQALAVQRDERQARAEVLAALGLEEKLRREAAATAAEVIEQQRKQAKQDAENKEANDRANLAAWSRVNRERGQEGLPPITFEQYTGEQK